MPDTILDGQIDGAAVVAVPLLHWTALDAECVPLANPTVYILALGLTSAGQARNTVSSITSKLSQSIAAIVPGATETNVYHDEKQQFIRNDPVFYFEVLCIIIGGSGAIFVE